MGDRPAPACRRLIRLTDPRATGARIPLRRMDSAPEDHQLSPRPISTGSGNAPRARPVVVAVRRGSACGRTSFPPHPGRHQPFFRRTCDATSERPSCACWVGRDARLVAERPRRARKVILSCDPLEGRITPAHGSALHHVAAAVHAHHHHAHSDSTSSTSSSTTVPRRPPRPTSTHRASGSSTSSGDSSSSSSTSLSTALATLQSDVLTIEQASGTTVGELAAIRSAFDTLASDGLTPSSQSALQSFENSLVTAFASGTTLAGDSTLLSQFEALYTSSPTTQETTDLTTAYNALAAAVTSSNITSADITTINTDWAAVQSAEGSSSTATYPYFNLVVGQDDFGGPGVPHQGGGMAAAGGCMADVVARSDDPPLVRGGRRVALESRSARRSDQTGLPTDRSACCRSQSYHPSRPSPRVAETCRTPIRGLTWRA